MFYCLLFNLQNITKHGRQLLLQSNSIDFCKNELRFMSFFYLNLILSLMMNYKQRNNLYSFVKTFSKGTVIPLQVGKLKLYEGRFESKTHYFKCSLHVQKKKVMKKIDY